MIKDYFNQLSPRERIIIIIGGLFLSLFFFITLIISPTLTEINKLQSEVPKLRLQKEWMAEAALTITTNRGTIYTNTGSNGKATISTISQSIQRANLSPKPKKISPGNNNEVNIWFDDINFKNLLSWLTTISQDQGLNISKISISKGDEPGLVKANMAIIGGN